VAIRFHEQIQHVLNRNLFSFVTALILAVPLFFASSMLKTAALLVFGVYGRSRFFDEVTVKFVHLQNLSAKNGFGSR
jgi:hypothetical protein